jgi:hypothetical protein
MPGFGPLGANASTVRPSATPDAYGVQTWAKDCSAAGASDGTIIDASWFNTHTGNWVYAAGQVGVTITNDQTNDTYFYQIIQNIAQAEISAAITSPTLSWGL